MSQKKSQADRQCGPRHGPIEGTGSDGEALTLTARNLADIIEVRYGAPRDFCTQVKGWLHDYGITQATLAQEIGMDLGNLNRWLNAKSNPSLKSMLLMDEALERLISDREGS